MKLKSLFASASLVSVSALAHIETGVYRGTGDGMDCDINVEEIAFEGGFKHPLNERVKVTANRQLTFSLSHLPKVDLAAGKIEHEKGILTGVLVETLEGTTPIKTALVLEMSQTGPVKYTMLQEFEGTTVTSVCADLRKTGDGGILP